jgi:hypothetical protein
MEQAQHNRVLERVLAMTRAQLDHFLSFVDLGDMRQPMRQPDAHWLFTRDPLARRETGDDTPGDWDPHDNLELLYRGTGSLAGYSLSARRVAFMLHYQQDPVQRKPRRHIVVLCGQPRCVNPLHQGLSD